MLYLRPKGRPKMRDRATGLLVTDEDSPAYRGWLQTYGYIKVVLGLAEMTLRDRQGHVCWQSQGDMQHMAQAIQALKDMGIATPHVETLLRAIDALSTVEQEQEFTELLGN